MKNKFFLLAALLFVSCASLPTVMPDRFQSLSQINEWVYDNIRYDNVKDDTDTVARAETTLQTRQGTCFDMCVLMQYLAKQSGWTVKVLPIDTGTGYHVIVDAGSLGYYDPTNDRYLGYSLPKGWKVTTF
jgi:hypothetical protein